MTIRITWIGALGIVLVLLRLLEVIDWSWVWVLAPFWIFPVSVALVIIIGYPIFWGRERFVRWRRRRKRREGFGDYK